LIQSFGPADNGRATKIGVHREFSITLPETRTTGFRWTIDELPPILEVIEDTSNPPTDSQPGAGGTRSWCFRGVGTGRGRLRLSLQARTERNSDAAPFELTIEIVPD